jgi:hypothetical protein
MIPQGAVMDFRSDDAGAVYTYQRAGGTYALAFRGTAGKPEWHYRFKTEGARDQRIDEFFASIQHHKTSKAERRQKASAYRHDVKPGDIFRASWGYDQTNIDYYQVVRLIGEHMAEVREIQQQSEDTAYMQGKCVPMPGAWATEAYYDGDAEQYKAEHGLYPRRDKAPFRVKIQGHEGGEPYFRVASYCSASRIKPLAEIAGAKVFAASHWTAYA